MKVIDCENHFFTTDYLKYLRTKTTTPREVMEKAGPNMWYTPTMSSPRSELIDNTMNDLGSGRLKLMDAAGVDIAALSLSPPGVQDFTAKQGTIWAKKVNDELAVAVKNNPKRYIGFASVAPQEPQEAAKEIERCAKTLGLKGLALHSHARGKYLDGPEYRVIFEKAAKYEMPVYVHPAIPSKLILSGYETYGFELAGPVLGFAADVALHSMRLICSGLFDDFPKLQVILGHLGEGLPFFLNRIDVVSVEDWKRTKMRIKKKPSEYIKNNFTVLTSGMHYLPAFTCAYMALGADRIAFGTDYAYVPMGGPVEFMKKLDITAKDKEKIMYGNIAKLFKLE